MVKVSRPTSANGVLPIVACDAAPIITVPCDVVATFHEASAIAVPPTISTYKQISRIGMNDHCHGDVMCQRRKDHERVKYLMVTKNVRDRVGPSQRVDESAERVE